VSAEPNKPKNSEDGRSARREQNVLLALNAARALFEESRSLPTIEDVAARSGLSIRSMYRYFKDIGEVTESVVELVADEARTASRLPNPAGVSTADRIDAFARARVTIYESVRGTYLANIARMIHSPETAQSGAAIRAEMLAQFTNQFEQELLLLNESERGYALECGHALTSMEFVDVLMRWRSMTADEAIEAIKYGLTKILTPA
jgi:AcrR family transcriptional regulator